MEHLTVYFDTFNARTQNHNREENSPKFDNLWKKIFQLVTWLYDLYICGHHKVQTPEMPPMTDVSCLLRNIETFLINCKNHQQKFGRKLYKLEKIRHF